MLDVKTLKVLDFLNEHPDEAFSIYQMGKCGMTVNFETMQWLTDKNMVFRYEDEDAFRMRTRSDMSMKNRSTPIRSMLVVVLRWKNKSISQRLKGVPTLLLVCRF